MSNIDTIRIEVIAGNQTDADLGARLVAASFNNNGFEDVTNLSQPLHIDRDEEVVEAMRNLSPSIFNAEITIEASVFDPSSSVVGVDDDGDSPGETFPDPNADGNDED